MGKDYCAFKHCKMTKGKIGIFGKAVKMHFLPKNEPFRSEWLKVIKINRKNFVPSPYTQVCSDHFPRGEGRTWRYNVPIINLPLEEHQFEEEEEEESLPPGCGSIATCTHTCTHDSDDEIEVCTSSEYYNHE